MKLTMTNLLKQDFSVLIDKQWLKAGVPLYSPHYPSHCACWGVGIILIFWLPREPDPIQNIILPGDAGSFLYSQRSRNRLFFLWSSPLWYLTFIIGRVGNRIKRPLLLKQLLFYCHRDRNITEVWQSRTAITADSPSLSECALLPLLLVFLWTHHIEICSPQDGMLIHWCPCLPSQKEVCICSSRCFISLLTFLLHTPSLKPCWY